MEGDFRVGDWLVHPDRDVIESPEQSIQLEPKAMDLLVYLAEHSGQVVSKQRLIQAVWSDAFVTDEVLTNNIWKLRQAFGDDPKSPSFIETVPRKGYRLIAPVVGETQTAESFYEVVATAGRLGVGHWPLLGAGLALVLILTVLAMVVGWPSQKVDKTPRGPLKITPFTTEGGEKGGPRFSPDGERVAYDWDGPGQDNWDIYVKAIGVGSKPLRLTEFPGGDYSPAWSPDGREIAFTRVFEQTRTIYLIPSMGGPERKLVDLEGVQNLRQRYGLGGVSWSPDGETLIFAESETSEGPAAFPVKVSCL